MGESGCENGSIVAPPQPDHSWKLVFAGSFGLIVYAERLAGAMQWPTEFFNLNESGAVTPLGVADSVAVNVHDNTVIMITIDDGTMRAVERTIDGEGSGFTQFVLGGVTSATAEWDAFGRYLYLFINSGTGRMTIRAVREP